MDEIERMDAIFFGAIGDPRVRPGIMERGVILRLRNELNLFLNIRPAKSLPFSKFKMDTAIFRENTEEFYMGFGGKLESQGTRFDYRSDAWSGGIEVSGQSDDELFFNLGIMSRKNVTRYFRKVLSFSEWTSRGNVTVVDKANAVSGLYEVWREAAKKEFSGSGIEPRFMYGDALAYDLVLNPSKFSLIAAPNLYGDILSDLSAGMIGGLGFAPSGNYGSEKIALFEPVHGSAPDIAGKGIANPVSAVLSGAMMLQHLGMRKESNELRNAVDAAISGGIRTFDIGGEDGTVQVTESILKNIS